MFRECDSLVTLDLTGWAGTGDVEYMQSMFEGCDELKSVNLSGWDVTGLTDASSMFRRCSNLTSVNVSDWGFSSESELVLAYFFAECPSLSSIDVNNWNMDGAVQVSSMFYNCTGLTSLDLSNWTLRSARSISGMFYGCSRLKQLDISSFRLGSNCNQQSLFAHCSELIEVTLGVYNPFLLGSNGALLPATTQTSEYKYTGKWVRQDGTYGPYTPEVLRDSYTTDFAGVWILEKELPNAYAVLVEEDDNTLYFVKSSSDEIFAGGVVATVPSISGDDYTGIVYPVSLEEGRTWDAIASTVKHVVTVDEIVPLTMANWFANFSACTDFDLDKLDTSFVTNMNGLFSQCSGGFTVDLDGLETQNVTNMSYMFSGAVAESLDFSEFDTSSLTTVMRMFAMCECPALDLSTFDMSHVTSLNAMFSGCKCDNINVSGWDVSNVTNIANTFNGLICDNTLDLTSWDTSSVTNMEYLFGQSTITTVDCTGWDVSKVTGASYMVNGGLLHLIAPDWHLSSLTSNGNMFYGRRMGSVMDVPRWSFGALTSCYYMCSFGSGDMNAQDWNLDGVTSINNMFRQNSGGVVNISGWHSNTLTNSSYLFDYSSGVTEVDLSDWDMPLLNTVEEMFGWCSGLRKVIGFDTWPASTYDGITNTYYMFAYAGRLEFVDLSKWSLPNLEQCGSMFVGCTSIVNIDINGFDTTHVTNIGSMFGSCIALETLDISGMNNINVTSMGSIFYGASNIREVVLGDVSPWIAPGYSSYPTNELPIPPAEKNGIAYSGRWIREDGLYGGYTPQKLAAEYRGVMAGTWVWEKALGTGYTIVFEAPEGSLGSMPVTLAPNADVEFALPACAFRRPGAKFSYWLDEENSRSYYSVIGGGTYQPGQIITLRAVFDGDGGEAVLMQNGEFEFSIKKDQQAIFTGLPAEIQYQIYEETPSGWMLIAEEGSTGTIHSEQRSTAEFVNQSIYNKCSLILSGEKFIGDDKAGQKEFQFELLDENGNVVSTAVTGDGGNIVFDALTFTAADVDREIYYTVREVLPGSDVDLYGTTDEGVTYDTHEERIRVIVSYELKKTAAILSHTENFDKNGDRINPVVPLEEPIVRYYHSGNMNDNKERDMETTRLDDTPIGDYESNRAYPSLVQVPGAAKLHLRIEYTNPRGNFWLWSGYHEEVRTGTWSATCNPNVTLRTFAGPVYDEILVEELDIDGDSFSCWYSSYALPLTSTDPAYNENSNFGYHITVTVTEMMKSSGVRADGTFAADYVSYKDYSDIITIPGAESLHVELSYSVPRGNFCIWQGAHAEVKNGSDGFSDDFSPDTALKSYSYDIDHENEIFTDSFDVEGDSLSVWYNSYARGKDEPLYGANVNYGYNMKVTPVKLGGTLSDYVRTVSTPNVLSDGTQQGNYTPGRDYVDVISIPGATGLRFQIWFNMGDRDSLKLYNGNHPEYDGNTTAGYVGSMYNTSSYYYNYTIPNTDTATFVFHADADSTGGNGLGYYAKVYPLNALGELHAEAIYDEDGMVFENQPVRGDLRLTKLADASYNGTVDPGSAFIFEVSFYNDKHVAYELDSDVDYYTAFENMAQNLLNVYHVCIGPTGEEQILYSERHTYAQVGDIISVKAKSFAGFIYSHNDYLNNADTALAVAVTDAPRDVKLYYEATPRTLTVKHVLLNTSGRVVSTADTEQFTLVSGESVNLALKEYGGYAYIANSHSLNVAEDNTLQGFVMPDRDAVVTIRYKSAVYFPISHGLVEDPVHYKVTLEDYTGVPVVGGVRFVNNSGTIVFDEQAQVYVLKLPYGTKVIVDPIDSDVFSYRIKHSWTDNINNSYQFSRQITGTDWYLKLFKYRSTSVKVEQYTVEANGSERLAVYNTLGTVFPGEPIGELGLSDTSTIYSSKYYYFMHRMDPGPETILPENNEDFVVKVYYGVPKKITVRYVQIRANGTRYVANTRTESRAINSPFTLSVTNYSGYNFDSAVCTSDSSVALTYTPGVPGNGVKGTMGTSDLTVEIIYRVR